MWRASTTRCLADASSKHTLAGGLDVAQSVKRQPKKRYCAGGRDEPVAGNPVARFFLASELASTQAAPDDTLAGVGRKFPEGKARSE
jgi:hypothetical protein